MTDQTRILLVEDDLDLGPALLAALNVSAGERVLDAVDRCLDY